MTLQASGAISFSDINTELGLSSTSQISMNDAAVRTLFSQASGAISMTAGYGKSNTSTPGAPTGVSGSSATSSSISVSFSAPACNGHLTIDYYQAISSPGCITATGTSPISVTGLSPSTAYTFRVRAHNSKGYGCYSSSSGSITTSVAPGSALYTTTGIYTWVVPTGVTSISAVVVSTGGNAGCFGYFCGVYIGGQGGGGGGLSYRNNFSVTPGDSFSLRVAGAGGSRYYSGASRLCAPTVNVVFAAGACYIDGGYGCGSSPRVNGTGGQGGAASYSSTSRAYGGGGGGAAGYGGTSGSGGTGGSTGCAGVNGGGGGGNSSGNAGPPARGGGGIGIYGQGANGDANGGGGSGGNNAGNNPAGCNYLGNRLIGGSYGGGAGGSSSSGGYGSSGAGGFVRIVWPGSTRQFPSTCVGSP
jgi:hypothetical protein